LNAFSAFLFAGREGSQFSREINDAYPLNPLISTRLIWDTADPGSHRAAVYEAPFTA
jgi:hypothetical protein